MSDLHKLKQVVDTAIEAAIEASFEGQGVGPAIMAEVVASGIEEPDFTLVYDAAYEGWSVFWNKLFLEMSKPHLKEASGRAWAHAHLVVMKALGIPIEPASPTATSEWAMFPLGRPKNARPVPGDDG